MAIHSVNCRCQRYRGANLLHGSLLSARPYAIATLCLLLLTGCNSRTPSQPPATPLHLAEVAVRSAPADITKRRTLAELYRTGDEKFAALQQYAILATLPLSTEDDRLRLADLYAQLGEYEETVNALRVCMAQHADSQRVRLQLALYQFKLGFFEEAAESVHPLISVWATLSHDQRATILQYLTFAGDTSTVERLSTQDNKQDNRDVEEFAPIRALAFLQTDQSKQAIKLLLRYLDSHPQDYDSVYLLGLALLRQGQKQQALSVWKRLASLPEAMPRARFHAATLLAEQGHAKEAEKLLRDMDEQATQEAQNDPLYWSAWYQIALHETGIVRQVQTGIDLGYLAFNEGDPLRAEASWRTTLREAQGEDRQEIYAAIYNSAFRRHDTDTSLAITSDALKNRPQDPYFLKRRSETLLGQNRLAEALSTAQTLEKVAPPVQEPETTELLCRIALDSGNPALLEAQAKRHRQLVPKDPNPLLHLAEWQTQQGKSPATLQASLSLYQEAIAVAPDNAEALARYGMALADLGRDDEAITALMHAFALSPRVLDGAANARLAQIYQKRGQDAERNFQLSRYALLQKSKVVWPPLLKALRQDRPFDEWLALGKAALERREDWIALCAFKRCVGLAPGNHDTWMLDAAINKRLGRLDETLQAVQHASMKQKQTRRSNHAKRYP